MLWFAVASQPISFARSAGFCGPMSWCSPGSLMISYTQPSLQSCTGHILATPAPLGPLEALGYTGPVHPLWSVDPPLRPCVCGDALAAPPFPPPIISLCRPLINVLGETCKYVRAQLVSAPPLRIMGHISMLSTRGRPAAAALGSWEPFTPASPAKVEYQSAIDSIPEAFVPRAAAGRKPPETNAFTLTPPSQSDSLWWGKHSSASKRKRKTW